MLVDRFGKPIEQRPRRAAHPAAPPPAPAAEEPRPGLGWVRSGAPRISRNMMLGGIGAALAAGAVFGLMARPELGDAKPAPRAMTPAAEEASVTPLPVELAAVRPATAPPAPPPGKLEVLPPDMARAAKPAPSRPAAREPSPPREESVPEPPEVAAREAPGEPASARLQAVPDDEPLLELPLDEEPAEEPSP